MKPGASFSETKCIHFVNNVVARFTYSAEIEQEIGSKIALHLLFVGQQSDARLDSKVTNGGNAPNTCTFVGMASVHPGGGPRSTASEWCERVSNITAGKWSTHQLSLSVGAGCWPWQCAAWLCNRTPQFICTRFAAKQTSDTLLWHWSLQD